MKKIVAFLLCLLLIVSQAAPVWAEEPETDEDAPLIWLDTLRIEYPDGREYALSGDTVYILLQATDNVAIKDFWLQLDSPDGSRHIKDYLTPLGVNDYYYYAFSVDENTDAGYWTLSRLKVTDTSEHSMYYYDPAYYQIGVHGSFSADEVNLPDGNSYIYSPAGVKPDVRITHRGATLQKDVDYTVTYQNNKSVGTATLTVRGINCFEGEVTKSFAITPQTTFTARLSCDTYYYTKEVKTPKVLIYDGEKRVPAANYTITYPRGRKLVGTYTVKVKMQGNYAGSKSLSFTINPKNTKIKSIQKQKKGFVLKWKKHAAQTKGYQLQYATNKNFKNAKTITIKNVKTTQKSVKKLKARTRYYVRIRCINGKHHSKWSEPVSVVTK